MTTPNAIKSYRQHLGLTQAELARQIGLTQGFIGHCETGRKRPSAETAIRIEQATHGSLTRAALRPDLFE